MENQNKHSLNEIGIGDKITYITSNVFTSKNEVNIKEIRNGKLFYSLPKKRIKNPLPTSKNSLIFKGHDIPVLIDSEVLITEGDAFTSKMSFGDCNIHIGGTTIEETTKYIQENNMNENFSDWGRLIYHQNSDDKEGTRLFPKESQEF